MDLLLIREHYPELALGRDPVTGLDSVEGKLRLLAPKSGVNRPVPVRIVFPLGYPHSEPRAFDYTDRFMPHDPVRHFYSSDGSCCLWLPFESSWQEDHPDGLLDFIAHVAVFMNHQLLFDVSGRWPVPARGHGPDGYREYLVEKLGISPQEFLRFAPLFIDGSGVAYLPCPCGSDKYAKRCHLVVVNDLMATVGRARLRDLVGWIIASATSEGGVIVEKAS